MKHTNTLTNVRVFTAQPNEKKPHKTYGHKVAELIFENSKGGRESTYVDPTNENNALWLDILETYANNRPCRITLEYEDGVRWFNKDKGIINADLRGVAPKVTSMAGVSDPKELLFE